MKQSMKQCWSNRLALGMEVCALLTVLAACPAVLAQKPVNSAMSPIPGTAATGPAGAAAQAKPKPVAAQEDESEKPNKPGREGIKVHGHWVLQVENADGTLGERREFNNSLVTTYSTFSGEPDTTSGSAILAAALSGDIAVGNPAIGFVQGTLSGDPSTWCGFLTVTPNITCFAYAPTNSLWNLSGATGPFNNGGNAGVIYSTVGLNETVNFTPTASLVLTGNYTVPPGLTSVSAVQSLYGACAPASATYLNTLTQLQGSGNVRVADLSPSACIHSILGNSATEAVILGALTSTAVQNSSGAAQPLGVSPGQIVTVTLTLSFS
jgi:hypothetical protein